MSTELNITPSTELQPAPLFTPTPQAAQDSIAASKAKKK